MKIFARYGWNWGGNWKTFKDLPHFEKKIFKTKNGIIAATWRNLAKLPRNKKGYITE